MESAAAECILQNNVKLVVFSVYRPPAADFDLFIAKLQKMLNDLYNVKNRHILCGDFNVNLLINSKQSRLLISTLREFNLSQSVHAPTRITATSATCIDNMFTDWPEYVTAVDDCYFSDHTFQLIEIKMNSAVPENKRYKTRVYSQENNRKFKSLMDGVDWTGLFDQNDSVNESFDKFYNFFLGVFNESYHYAWISSLKRENKTWVTPDIRNLSKMLREMSIICKSTNNQYYKDRFKFLKQFYHKKVLLCKRTVNDNRLITCSNRNTECWRIISEMSKTTKDKHITSIEVNDQLIKDAGDIANKFNNFFAAMSETTNKPAENAHLNVLTQNKGMFLYPTDPHEVRAYIHVTCKKNHLVLTRYPEQ